MATAVVISIRLEPTHCGVCSIPFALHDSHLRHLRETGREFYCPNGHSISFHGTEIERLKKRLAWQEAENVRERTARARAEEREKKVTRKLKRVEKGVCPECNRHFVNVERHMATMHSQADVK